MVRSASAVIQSRPSRPHCEEGGATKHVVYCQECLLCFSICLLVKTKKGKTIPVSMTLLWYYRAPPTPATWMEKIIMCGHALRYCAHKIIILGWKLSCCLLLMSQESLIILNNVLFLALKVKHHSCLKFISSFDSPLTSGLDDPKLRASDFYLGVSLLNSLSLFYFPVLSRLSFVSLNSQLCRVLILQQDAVNPLILLDGCFE